MADGPQPQKEGRLVRLRREHEWLDRLIRAWQRYQKQYGDYYAAGITYFSVLALVPLLMIAFSVAGFVLTGNRELLAKLQQSIITAVPSAELSGLLNQVVEQAIHQAGAVGVIGLLAALYSGLGWMTNLREALTAQWTQASAKLPVPRKMASDLLQLVGFGIALGLSLGISALGSGFGRWLLRLAGIGGPVAAVVLWLLAVVLSLVAGWLVFLWVLTRLPRKPVTLRSAVRGAVFAAIGFEVLKQVGVIYLDSVTNSPAGAAFGPILGLLVFANLTARFILFVTAWTASARDNQEQTPPQPPAPAMIRPVIQVRRLDLRTTAGFFGLGALAGWVLRWFRRR